jgi:hypothetical protein
VRVLTLRDLAGIVLLAENANICPEVIDKRRGWLLFQLRSRERVTVVRSGVKRRGATTYPWQKYRETPVTRRLSNYS